MKSLLTTQIGRLRLIGYLEGVSLLLLIFVAVPLKYGMGDPTGTKMLGPVHGVLFLLFVFNTLSVGIEYKWKFSETTWKVILACFIPFGIFYIDKKILNKL